MGDRYGFLASARLISILFSLDLDWATTRNSLPLLCNLQTSFKYQVPSVQNLTKYEKLVWRVSTKMTKRKKSGAKNRS